MRFLVSGFWFLAPAVAAACPYCAGRDEGGSIKIALLGSMILFPFGVAFVVSRIIKRAERLDD